MKLALQLTLGKVSVQDCEIVVKQSQQLMKF